MNRHYTKEEYIDLIHVLREKINGLTISTDLILGFPGETDELFQETLQTLKMLHFSHIHAFPYSPRKGTPAAKFDNQIPEPIKKQRVSMVNELSSVQKKEEIKMLIGTTANVLIEKQDDQEGEGFTENYERVLVDGLKENSKGTIVSVYLLSVLENNILKGKMKEES
jgi:threonylcarbamoyladenosine tRNA methylthiotransferase MtaB